MTHHFKHSLRGISILLVVLGIAFLWLAHKANQVITLPPSVNHSKLAIDEKELIEFNEKTHRVSVITRTGTTKMYARNPTVRVKKNGNIKIDRHLFGFESRPFIGLGYAGTTRAMLGLQPVYWGAFDASVSVGVALDRDFVLFKPYVAVGYNCWGNMSINAGINPAAAKQLDTILFVSLKI